MFPEEGDVATSRAQAQGAFCFLNQTDLEADHLPCRVWSAQELREGAGTLGMGWEARRALDNCEGRCTILPRIPKLTAHALKSAARMAAADGAVNTELCTPGSEGAGAFLGQKLSNLGSAGGQGVAPRDAQRGPWRGWEGALHREVHSEGRALPCPTCPLPGPCWRGLQPGGSVSCISAPPSLTELRVCEQSCWGKLGMLVLGTAGSRMIHPLPASCPGQLPGHQG